jgi:carboxylate-amine ligase
MPSATAALPFLPSDSFTLGVEEELLLVAPASLLPLRATDAVLADLDPGIGSITGEVSDGVLELLTPVCDNVGEAIDVLGRLRGEVGQRARLLGAGVHAPVWGRSRSAPWTPSRRWRTWPAWWP